MNALTNANNIKAQVRAVLDTHKLGSAYLAEDNDELHVFLETDSAGTLSMHMATSDLERATGKSAQIRLISGLGPAERSRLEQVASPV